MQPTSGAQGTLIQAAGTVVISNKNVNLKSVVFLGTYVGSVELYNSSTAAGTTAGNLVYNVGLPLLNAHKDVQINQELRTGLTYVATGTPSLIVTWG